MGDNLILFELGDSIQSIEKELLFKDLSWSDLLSIVDSNGVSNLERIFLSYPFERQQQLYDQFIQEKKKLGTNSSIKWEHEWVIGTYILIPKDRIFRAVAARDGGARQLARDSSYKKVTDASLFIGEEIKAIQSQSGYRKLILGTHGVAVKKEVPKVRVYVWCRGMVDDSKGVQTASKLGERTKSDGLQDIDNAGLLGRVIDISRYIQDLTSTVDDNGGNFQIKLPPIQGMYSKESQGWEIDKSCIKEYSNNVTGQSSLYQKDKNGNPIRTEFLFKNILSNNDIVFLSYEPLAYESDRASQDLSIDNILNGGLNTMLSNHHWDMIGLIDTVSQLTNPSNNEVSINVLGRDLSKLVIDDGSYLFPLLFDEHNFLNKDSKLIQRILFTGSYNFYAEPKYRTIQDAVTWIINVVSNIRVIPEKVGELLHPQGSVGFKEVYVGTKSTELWRNIVEEFRLLDSLQELYRPQLKLTDLEKISIVNQVKEIVWQKVQSTPSESQVNITYSDYSPTLRVHLPLPLDGEIVVNNYRGSVISSLVEEGGGSLTFELIRLIFDTVTVPDKDYKGETIESVGGGIWRWVKLLFDDTITSRKLADVGLGRPDGSLINLIWNYAQSPWVEFYMDTWGPDFYFIFRTPPWTKKLILQHYDNKLIDNVVVEDVDVLQEDLDFDTECYSIYQIDYKAAAWGTTNLLASVIPTVPFPELAEIWGNRRLRVSTNLLPFNTQEDSESSLNRSYLRDRGIDDLMFVIDTTIYKPFTRRGTITVNGDRRLKKGTWFLYKPTNEIFYILSVTQTYSSSLDRVTTITVERGMVLEYVLGGKSISVGGKSIPLTYFSIIDSDGISGALKDQLKTTPSTESQPSQDIDRVVDETYNSLKFETNKSVILQQSFTSLNKLAELLKSNPTWSILLQGHTDSDGGHTFNMGLSKRRVESVKSYLVKQGVNPGKVQTEFYGQTKPIDTNSTEEGKSRNRRVDIQILEQKKESSVATPSEVDSNVATGGKGIDSNIFKINRPVLNFFLQRRQFGRDKVVIDNE